MISVASLFWFGVSVIIGVLAATRGRNCVLWFLSSLLLSSVVTGIVLYILPEVHDTPSDTDT